MTIYPRCYQNKYTADYTHRRQHPSSRIRQTSSNFDNSCWSSWTIICCQFQEHYIHIHARDSTLKQQPICEHYLILVRLNNIKYKPINILSMYLKHKPTRWRTTFINFGNRGQGYFFGSSLTCLCIVTYYFIYSCTVYYVISIIERYSHLIAIL